MPKSHKELICWQLADELRQLITEHTKEGTPAATDLRFTSNLRDAVASACRNQSAKRMAALCGRAMIANLRWLKSLDRPDPD